jgi:hypothetical protein
MSRAIALVLALTLVLTSQAFALARGQAAAAGQMVICTGTGFVMLTVDADGNPTGPAHVCPDAIAVLGALVPPPALPVRPAVLATRVTGPAADAPLLSTAPQGAQARGPPVLV